MYPYARLRCGPRKRTKILSRNEILNRPLEPLALLALALNLALAADGFGLFAGFTFGRLFVIAAQLHFTEHAFALQLLLQGAERLVNIIVTDEDLHERTPPKNGVGLS